MTRFDAFTAPKHSVEETADWQAINKIKEAFDGAQYVRVFHNTELAYVGDPDKIDVYTVPEFEDINMFSLFTKQGFGHFTMAQVGEIIEKLNELIWEDEQYDETSTARYDIGNTDEWKSYLKSMG
jgi:hypothetical protein